MTGRRVSVRRWRRLAARAGDSAKLSSAQLGTAPISALHRDGRKQSHLSKVGKNKEEARAVAVSVLAWRGPWAGIDYSQLSLSAVLISMAIRLRKDRPMKRPLPSGRASH